MTTAPRRGRRGTKRVHLNRALSKLGILTRSQANAAILEGRVRVDGRLCTNPAAPVDLDRARLSVDGKPPEAVAPRTLLLHKPRGVVTTRRDPEGRKTIYDVVGEAADGLVPVGRLDFATSGVLLLTTDTERAAWIADPANRVLRVYIVSVRGRVMPEDVVRLERGVDDRGDLLRAESIVVRKASGRESHLIVELTEGKNREIRRLFEHVGHEVTRLKRVRIGGLELGALGPGEWREVDRAELDAAFRRNGA